MDYYKIIERTSKNMREAYINVYSRALCDITNANSTKALLKIYSDFISKENGITHSFDCFIRSFSDCENDVKMYCNRCSEELYTLDDHLRKSAGEIKNYYFALLRFEEEL